MEGNRLMIRVKHHIAQYLRDSIQSDVIKVDKGRAMMTMIKPYLTLEPDEWEQEPLPEGMDEIFIELPKLNQEWEEENGVIYWCNELFRDHLSKRGLDILRNFFNKNFRAAYRSFMDGYTESQQDATSLDESEARLKVKRGAAAFLCQYHIDLDEKLIRAMVRDWYRHTERNEQNRYSPLIY